MAKKRRARPVTEGIYPSTRRPPTSERAVRRNLPPPSSRGIPTLWLVLGVVAVALVVVVGGYAFLAGAGGGATPRPTSTVDTSRLHPPSATPLASPPAAPAGDGTTATIETDLGNIVINLFTDSAPVAASNFINLAEAGFYNGVGFHRLVPDFVIQGGDPEGTGGGGPGYTIQDEPVVGEYGRGIVAMARNSQPNSQGSQFFIVLSDNAHDALQQFRTYVIFGEVSQGMDVVDAIGQQPNSGSPSNAAIDPVIMNWVTIQRP